MREYTTDDYERWYTEWAYNHERNLTDTSESLGIPLRTLRYRKSKEGWDQRYMTEQAEVAGSAVAAAAFELKLRASTVALHLVKDATSDALEPKDRRESQRLFFQLVGAIDTEDRKPSQHLTLVDARSIVANALDGEDAASLASKAIAANVANANALALRGSRPR